MKLNIPQQSVATDDSTPSNPRKLKKVLSTLPNTNMGELTKQTFHILRDQNRQVMPHKQRLENLEMIRVLTRGILDNLKKYFINRTLPLPDKSQKIINLNQSILQELIYGYVIITKKTVDNSDEADDKTLTIAICRAINYISEMLLRSSEIYETSAVNLWTTVHQLYVLAENKNLLDNVVLNDEREQKETSIGNSYKQILLFSLARPTALTQSDSDRIYNELFNWTQYASVLSEASEDMIDCHFCMQVNKDLAPYYLGHDNMVDDKNVRILDTKNLVFHIADLVEKQSKKKQEIIQGEKISVNTLTSLINSWGESPKRKFTRAIQHGHINVAIGLSKICKAMSSQEKTQSHIIARDKFGFIQTEDVSNNSSIDSSHDFFQSPEHDHSKEETTLKPPTEDPHYTLQDIDEDNEGEQLHSALDLKEEKENAWDMVAKGRTLTQAYENSKQNIQDDLIPHSTDKDTHWEIVNISAGGYCLRWNSDNTSTAQIGELIALQAFSTDKDVRWHIGVIRWMQYTHKDGLEIGVQILSPQVLSATAQRVNRLDEIPFECLLLPEIKTLQQPPSALLPSHAFKTNAKLIVRVYEHKLNITLGEITEQTGSFTQFTYSNTDQNQRTKNQNKDDNNTDTDDFDKLWSSL